MAIGPRFLRAAAATLVILGGLVPASAQVARKGEGPLDKLTMVRPELLVGPRHVSAATEAAQKAPSALAAFRALQAARPEAGWRMTLDAVTGRPALLEGALPWTPGAGNALTAAAAGVPAGLALKDVPKGTMIDKALAFLKANPDVFGVDPNDLKPIDGATGPVGDSAYFIDFQWTRKGIEVEKAHVVFRVNHGNLVQVGQEYVGSAIATLDPTPSLSADDAWAAVRDYAGRRNDDRIVAPARLSIIPQADGDGIGYRLVYTIVFARPGERGTWEARIDARTGEVVSFRDADVYGSAHGHSFTHDQPADELDRPFAFVDVGQDGSGATIYADAYGRFSGASATSALSGKLAKIADNCGAISLSTTGGDLDFGASAGTDCATPGVGGAGNTRSARTQYYNVNKIKQKALTYLPSNTWLASRLTINVNINDTCNAAWSSNGTLNFFKSGGGCANTGELPGVSLHEFGHGLDTNDGNGFSPDNGTGETYGDFTAALQTHESCLGSGFLMSSICGGYGDACKTCTGVRDLDYAQHQNETPVTAAMLGNATGFHCPSYPSYAGPCGTEGHCESYIGSESLWDLVNRDLPAAGLDVPSAWQLVDRLWYASRPTATANYACTSGTSGFVTDGCGAGSLYTVLRAMDDDDGDLTNGTPHAAAIYAALARHGIACGAAADATNQNHAGCTAPGKPTLSGTPGDGQAVLAWSPVAGAQSYRVLRNEDGCSAGFTKVADVAGGSASGYTDGTPLNDLTYYYRVQALGGSDACGGPVSECATAMPIPRAATLRVDRAFVGCGATRIAVTLEDADLVGAGRQNVGVFSTVDGTPFTLTLTETGAATGVFTGSFGTISGSTSQGGAVATAEGATVTVRYLDAAPSARTVDAHVAIDCTAPTVSNVATSATDEALTVTWTTNEPSLTKLRWGTAAPPADELDGADGYTTSHSVTIDGLSMCAGYVFDILVEDRAGNAAVAANGGTHYSGRTTGRDFAFADDVERGAGTWTATTTSGSPIAVSTCRAHSGTQSWKFGDASCSAAYQSNTDASLVSAPINLGAAGHGRHLRFRQWVQTESGYDYCYLQISADGAKTWTNLVQPFAGESDGWIRWDIDLAAYTGTVQIRFRFKSDSLLNYEGWYIDDIDVGTPAACAAAPRRAGTTILDACHGTGSSPDGVADPGEHVRLPMTFFNAGGVAVTGLTATLATTDGRATVTNGATFVPDLAGGATVENGYPPFAAKIAGGAACGAQIPMTLTLAGTTGTWTEQYALQVGQNVVSGSATALDEHFDYPTGAASTWMPTGWAVTHSGAQANWLVLTSVSRSDCTGNGKSSATHSGGAYAADAWLFSKALALKAGTAYTLAFNLKAVTGTAKLDVALGAAQTAASMTTTLWTTSSFASSNCTAETASFTVPSDGTYYIGFHDKTAASSGTVGVDDVVLSYPTYTCVVHACTAKPLPVPGETAGTSGSPLLWSGSTKDTLRWGANADAANGYRLYQGAAADLAHAGGGQANACVRWSGTATTTGPVLAAAPATGQVQWFLVSGVNDAGEGPAAPGWTINSSGACR